MPFYYFNISTHLHGYLPAGAEDHELLNFSFVKEKKTGSIRLT